MVIVSIVMRKAQNLYHRWTIIEIDMSKVSWQCSCILGFQAIMDAWSYSADEDDQILMIKEIFVAPVFLRHRVRSLAV